jgi:hypothetical protein
VRYVRAGGVRRAGNRIRVTGQLIDATTGAHVWASRYDRDLADIFAVQDETTTAIAAAIAPAIINAEQERVLNKPAEQLDSWDTTAACGIFRWATARAWQSPKTSSKGLRIWTPTLQPRMRA